MAEENQRQEQAAPEIEKPTAEQRPEPKPEAPEEAGGQTQGDAALETKPEGEKPQRIHSSIQARIDRLTKERREAERREAALKIEIEQLRAGQAKPPEAAPEAPLKGAATHAAPDEAIINARAEQMYRQRVYQERVNGVLGAGNKEFQDFTDRCNLVAGLGASDRPDFMEIVTDPMIVPDGHKVIAALADDPNEAARILSLPSVAMSAELARFSERLGKPAAGKPISKAPPPIKPLAGNVKASDEISPDDSEEEFFRKRMAQRAAKKQAGRSL